MQQSLSRLLFASIAAVALMPANAQRPMSDQELTDRAEAIVIGRAIARETMWVGSDLVTLVTVSVAQPLKGSLGPNLTVALPGGIDRRRKIPIEVSYVDAPQLASGEEALLFLERADRTLPGSFVVTGYSQGKRSIITDAAGVKWVSSNHASLTGNSKPVGAARLSEVREGIRQRLRQSAP